MSTGRYISTKTKEQVLRRQKGRCANRPDNPALNLYDYKCLLWIVCDGEFDNAGFQFDHIIEYSKQPDSTEKNIQALCPNCHAVKTKRFMGNKKKYTSAQLDFGLADMEDVEKAPKKRKK